MDNENQAKHLEEQWQAAIARAQEETPREQALGDLLNGSAGLRVQSGVQAGREWGLSGQCTDYCGP